MAQTFKRQIVKSDGLDLVVEEAGQGPALLFAHGLTGSRVQSIRQVGALADRFHVIVFDQRGHAQSSPVTDAPLYDVQRMAQDTTAILDALGVDKAIIAGESMGAATSLRFALNHPERVSALMLCLPALSDVPNPSIDDLAALGKAMQKMGLAAFAEFNMRNDIASGASPDRARQWADIIRSHDTASMSLACQVVPRWIVYHDKADLQRLTMPVQLIAIDGDPVHPLALSKRLEHEIPHAQLLIVPATHYFEDPALLGRTCIDFLHRTGMLV
jgi:pimeloyl-ACP methyl ester carboxylesterase